MDSFYDQTIPVLTRVTRTAEHILKKAEEYSKSTGTPIEELLTASLAPDMYSFSKQVGVVVLFARRAVHGLVGTELVPTELAEWSLEESRSVIADVLKLLADIKPEDVNGKELDTLTFAVGPAKSTQNIKDYFTKFVVPTIYFHLTTMYAILRMKGVPLGKMDYMLYQVEGWKLS